MINIRPAVAADSLAVFEWRNDPLTRAVSATTGEVQLSDHQAWFARMLGSVDHLLYIAEDAGSTEGDAAIGMVRFDIVSDGTSADVSINLSPAFRGRGLGAPVLRAAIDVFDGSGDEPLPLHAVIRPTNAASIRIFEAVGFAAAGDDGVLLHFWRETHA